MLLIDVAGHAVHLHIIYIYIYIYIRDYGARAHLSTTVPPDKALLYNILQRMYRGESMARQSTRDSEGNTRKRKGQETTNIQPLANSLIVG